MPSFAGSDQLEAGGGESDAGCPVVAALEGSGAPPGTPGRTPLGDHPAVAERAGHRRRVVAEGPPGFGAAQAP